MYIPRTFREVDPTALNELMQRYGFATLFSWTDQGPMATHIPFMLDPDRGAHGTLMAHMARANPHWRNFELHQEVLVSFLGPHAYISPSWYRDPVTVPTWNYAAVHAYGVPKLVNDTKTLRKQVLQLTAVYESYVDPPWDPKTAEPVMPTELKAIVGFEIPIQRIEGKFKFNQNRSREDRASVVAALEQSSDPTAAEVAQTMRRHLNDSATQAERTGRT